MKLYGSIHAYIHQNGGKEAFDPTDHPDAYAELCAEINKVMASGNENLMSLTGQETLDFWARKYLGIPDPDGVVLP